MKKLIYILLFLFPVIAIAQQPWYKYSPMDYAWKNVGNAGFSAGEVMFTSLALSSSGQPYVAYQDLANSQKVTVMKFDGTNWVNLGSAGFSAGEADYTSLSFSPSGQPYVAYEDWGNSQKTTVMMFNGTNWVNVGNAGFSAGEDDFISLAFNPADSLPYVAFANEVNLISNKATVMKFNGTNWVDVGNSDFSAGNTLNESLAFSPIDSMPYVAFSDFGSGFSGKATVMKFNGTNWVYLGSEGFSAGVASYISLSINPSDGTPYVAFTDGANSAKATVMKFDGTNWMNVGNADFTTGSVSCISLAFSPTDSLPYITYSDGGDSSKATVMKFFDNNWVSVGPADFSAAQALNTSIAFSPSGQPFVAYIDEGDSGKATVMYYDAHAGIEELQSSQISIYPNPATDKITVELSGMTQGGNLTIGDIEGQQLLTRQIAEPKTQIDISNLPSGIYFVRITNEMTAEVGKFVKQ